MKKIVLISLLLISKLFAWGSSPPSIGSPYFFVGQKFRIYSEIQLPSKQENFNFDTFQWADEDHWQLVYCSDSIELVESHAMAPDGVGGNLLQAWTLRPHEKGNYKLVFKRLRQKIIMHITVK